MSKFKKKKEYVLSFLSALIMLVLTYFLLNSNRTYGDDLFLIKYSSIIKKIIFKIDSKPSQGELLFVNTSYDPMLIEKLDADSIPIGEQVITNREKLARLLRAFNKEPGNYKYIICDIFFKDASPFDSALYSELKIAKNTIIPYHGAGDDRYNLPIFEVKKGFADYDYIEGSFLKFKLIHNDTVLSIPLIMYKDLYNANYVKTGLFYSVNDKLCFNNIILDFKVRYYDILEPDSENHYPIVNLGEFVELSDSLINETVKNRIVLIGDFFENDIHKTIFGKMPGTMILLNAFLTLRQGDNIIPVLFFPYLFLCYFYLSYRIFNKDKKIGIFSRLFKKSFKKKPDIDSKGKKVKAGEVMKKAKIIDIIKLSPLGQLVFKFIGAATLFTLVSFLSYLIFNIHINVLILALFLESEKYFYSLYLERKKLKAS